MPVEPESAGAVDAAATTGPFVAHLVLHEGVKGIMAGDESSRSFDDTPEGFGEHTDRMTPALSRALSARPRDITILMEQLHRRVYDEDTLIDLMHRSSREAVRLLDGVDWAGVTAQFSGPAFTVAHTDERVLVVDEGQYGQGDGPCLRAIATGTVVTMSSEEVDALWPLLAAAVAAAGVRAFHAEPLHVSGHAVGCLNLYSAEPGGLADPGGDVVTVLIEYLDRGLTDYSSAQPGEAEARHLQEQLRARYVTNQAVGVLMARQGIGVDEARESLQRDASLQRRRVVDVARSVLDRPQQPPPPRRDLESP